MDMDWIEESRISKEHKIVGPRDGYQVRRQYRIKSKVLWEGCRCEVMWGTMHNADGRSSPLP